MHKFRERPNLHKFREGFFLNFVCFLHIEKNFPAMVRKCRSANARPQKSVRNCPSAKVGPQLPVRNCLIRKCPSAIARPQMSFRK